MMLVRKAIVCEGGVGAARIWALSGTLHCCSCCALFALWWLVDVQVQPVFSG